MRKACFIFWVITLAASPGCLMRNCLTDQGCYTEYAWEPLNVLFGTKRPPKLEEPKVPVGEDKPGSAQAVKAAAPEQASIN